MIKSISWDVGGVLLNYSENNYFKYLARKSGKDEKVVESKVDPKITALEAGSLSIKEFNNQVSIELGIKNKEVRQTGFFLESAVVNSDILEIVESLYRHGYQQSIISNIEIGRYRTLSKLFNTELFDFKFASGYLKIRKPHHRIFDYAIKTMGVTGEEVLFIDDRISNVDGARKAGLNAILFENSVKLLTDFSSFGIQTS